MKTANLALLGLMALLINACIPGDWIPTPIPFPSPVSTQTGTFPAETSTHAATASETPSSTLTETFTPPVPATVTETETPTPAPEDTATSSPSPLTVPNINDWDAGSLAFSHGAEGEWDHILWGGFANSLIKKGDTYYIYYQGSSSYDEDTCESVSQRAIGVATSTDGIHWVKSPQNPVITWSSQGSIEEGAASSAAWLGADGRIYVYYGANTGTGCTVNASARLAVSDDGETFLDVGEVLSGSDPNVWGSGDEIFPVGIYSHANQWNLYYIPNGVLLSRRLGVAVGNSPNSFTQSMGINNSTISAWGPVSIILNGPESVLVTNPDGPNRSIDFYRFDAENPSAVDLQQSYALPNCTQVSVLFESSARHWMIACRDQNADNYYIRNAFTP